MGSFKLMCKLSKNFVPDCSSAPYETLNYSFGGGPTILHGPIVLKTTDGYGWFPIFGAEEHTFLGVGCGDGLRFEVGVKDTSGNG